MQDEKPTEWVLGDYSTEPKPDLDGPQPIRHAGYVVHAIGQTIWLTPAHNSDEMSKTRH